MAYARIESYDNNKVVVSIGGLEHSGRDYDCFRLYLETTHMGWRDPTSDSYSNDAHVEFDITKTADGRTTQSGYYTAHVYGVYNGREYEIPISGNAGIRIENKVHKLTYIKLIEFISVEDGYVKVKIQTDGYGDVDLVSVTKGWDLTGRYRDDKYVRIAHDYIEEEHITNGEFYGTVSYNFNATDLSYFPSVPVGTCHLASGGGLYDNNYSIFSKEFLCMSKYNNWTVYRGTYATTLTRDNNGFNANVVNLDTVKQDWNRLVNMSFYLEATTYGDIKYSQYASYIPQSGDIITADMYNSLLSAVQRCCNRVGMSSSALPSSVSANQIISKYFISDIGVVVDRCLMAQRNNVNENVLRNQ